MTTIGSMMISFVGKAVLAESDREKVLLDTLRAVMERGDLTHIEVNDDLRPFYPHVFTPTVYKEMGRMAAELEVRWTVHLPFIQAKFYSPHEGIRKGAVETVLESYRATEHLEPDLYILHLFESDAFADWMMPIPKATWPFERALAQAESSLSEILKVLPPERLCIENLWGPVDAAYDVARRFGCGYCFDVGHVLLVGEDLRQAWKRHKHGVKEIHLHDVIEVDGKRKDHQALGRGIVPVAEVLCWAREQGCHVSLETGGWTDVNESIALLKNLEV